MINSIQQSSLDGSEVFSIVIPTWNNLPLLKVCIDSIQKNSKFKHQIIVHVNEGVDGTLEWLKENFDGDVSYSEKNMGVCYPLNYCASLVKTDYYCYFNDDMYACPNWDVPLIEAIKDRKDKLFFYSATQIQPFDFWDNGIIANQNFGTDAENFQETQLLNELEELEKEDWSGATWPPNVVHIDIWNLVGGYSVEFTPGMYSDPDFSMKLWNLGVRDFRGFGNSKVYHFESKSTKRVKKNKGAIQFLQKWGITSRAFGKHFLKRGEKYTGPAKEVDKSTLEFKTDKLRSTLKKIWQS